MSNPNFSLAGKVAIVTGAKRGIGKEIALTFAKAGANVAVCSRVIEDGQLDAVAKEIRRLGQRSVAVQVDVSRKADVDNMVQNVMDEFGRIDILVNNAGISIKGLLLEFNENDWDKTINTNLKGYFLCSQAAGKKMAERGKGGNIINIASISSIRPFLKSGPYSSSKAAVVMLTQTLALELASDNIRANAIAPGWVRTKMTEDSAKVLLGQHDSKSIEEYFEKVAAGTPLGRVGQPSDIAAAALFLASDVSSYTTGTLIVVDGGASLIGP